MFIVHFGNFFNLSGIIGQHCAAPYPTGSLFGEKKTWASAELQLPASAHEMIEQLLVPEFPQTVALKHRQPYGQAGRYVPPFSLPSRMISTISCVEIFALTEGTSNGDERIFSGTRANVRPSLRRIKTFGLWSKPAHNRP